MAYHNYVAPAFALPIFIIGFIAIIVLVIFIFEVVMFIHVIRNDTISDERKILWIIGMLLIHPFIAIAYYFTDYKQQ